MAGKRDISWVADRIVTTLQTYLPAQLNSIDAEYADGIVLDDIADENYFITEVRLPPGFPICCVIPDRTDTEPFSGLARYDIETHYLTVAVALAANEGEDQLKRECIRTLRGVEEVLSTYATLNGSVDNVLPLEKQCGPLLVSEDAMMQEAQLKIQVQTMVE